MKCKMCASIVHRCGTISYYQFLTKEYNDKYAIVQTRVLKIYIDRTKHGSQDEFCSKRQYHFKLLFSLQTFNSASASNATHTAHRVSRLLKIAIPLTRPAAAIHASCSHRIHFFLNCMLNI